MPDFSNYSPEETSAKRFLTSAPQQLPCALDAILVCGTIGTLYSPGGTGKSTFSCQIAIEKSLRSLSDRIKLIGHFPLSSGGKVLILVGEDPCSVIHQKIYDQLDSFCKQYGISKEEATELLSENLHIIEVSDDQNFEPLTRLESGKVISTSFFEKIKSTIEFHNPSLVIVDTKSVFSGVPENDNTLIAQEIARWKTLLIGTDAAMLVVHHTSKGSNNYRGASAFEYNLRCAISLRESTNVETLHLPKDKQYLTLENPKNNYHIPFLPLLIKRSNNFWFEPVGLAKIDKEVKMDRCIEKVIEFVSKQSSPITEDKIVQDLKGGDYSQKFIRQAISEALEQKKLINTGKGNRKQISILQNKETQNETV